MTDPVLLDFFVELVDTRLPALPLGLLPRLVVREQLIALGLTLAGAAQAEVEAGARRGWQQTVATHGTDRVIRVLDLRRRIHADVSLTALWEGVALQEGSLRPDVRQILRQTQPDGALDEAWSRRVYERWTAHLQGNALLRWQVREALLHVELDGLMDRGAVTAEIGKRLVREFGVLP